jgi:hypothetical protein
MIRVRDREARMNRCGFGSPKNGRGHIQRTLINGRGHIQRTLVNGRGHIQRTLIIPEWE